MPKLQDILDKDKEKIKSYCNRFGFDKVRVYCDNDTPALQLVVSESNADNQFSAALQAILLEELGCKVVVLVEDRIDDLYIGDLRGNSASIDDKTSLKQKFAKDLSQIEIQEFSQSDRNSNFVRALRLANEILGSKSRSHSATNSTLFHTKNDKNIKRKLSNYSDAASKRKSNHSTEKVANEKKPKSK